MKPNCILVKHLCLLLAVLLFCSVSVNSQQGADPIAEQIEQCNALEDNKPNEAIALAEQLLESMTALNTTPQYGQILGCLGWAMAVIDSTEEARKRAFQLEKLALNLPESIQSIKLLRRAGGIYHRVGDRISATENYDAAMADATAMSLKEEQIPLLVNLGVLNSEIREHEQAIKTYYQALELMDETNDYRYQPPVLFNLATTLNGQQRFTEGLKVFQQVESMINEHWPNNRVAQVYSGLAAAHTGLGAYDTAKDYAQRAINIYLEAENAFNDYHNILSTLAAILSKQGDNELALQYANQVKDYYTDPKNKQAILASTNPLHSLAVTYERLGLLSTAIEMHKLARKTDEEVQDTFNQQVMSQMQVRLDASQQREELALLKSNRANDLIRIQEAEHDRRLVIILSGVILTALLAFLWWQHRTKKILTWMAMTDSLTQLGNRRAIKEWSASHSLPKPPKSRLMWLIDLDEFKSVNDEFDHDFGDYALQEIAKTLSSLVNKDRFVGRWGGEEFMLITDDICDEEKDNFSSLLLQSIKATVIEQGSAKTQLTASVGLSHVVNETTSSWQKAMYQADKALYTAKSRGRNCVVIATDH